jgi:TonB family protein
MVVVFIPDKNNTLMKRILTLLFLIFTSLSAFCEKDTVIYYSKLGKIQDSQKDAVSYDLVKIMSDSISYLESYIRKDGKWAHNGDDRKLIKINDTLYVIYTKVTSPTDTIYRHIKKLESGYLVHEYQNKLLISTGISKMIFPLTKEGKWVNYYKTSQKIKSEEYYTANQMTGNKRWRETDVEDIADVFPQSEVDPEFPGGNKQLSKYLATNTQFPNKSRRHDEKGIVVVQFIILEDGIIDGVEILKGATPGLDAESLRVVKFMPPWKPGTINGKNVRVLQQVPFKYSLPNN